MSHNTVSPFKVTQLENRALRAEHENLRTQLQTRTQELQQTALSLEQERMRIGAIIQHLGGRIVLPVDFLNAWFDHEAPKYGVRQVPNAERTEVVMTVELRPEVSATNETAAEPPNDTAAVARPALVP